MRAVGIDLAFRSVGLSVVEVVKNEHATGDDWLREVGPLGQYAERLLHVTTLHPTKISKQHVLTSNADLLEAQNLFEQLLSWLRQQQPDLVAVELPSGGSQGNRASRLMGMATSLGACLPLTLSLLNIEPVFIWRTPEEVKEAVTGSRSGAKATIQETMRQAYPFDWPKLTKGDFEHVADSLGAVWAVRDLPEYRRNY